ncbi:DUF4293 domain-containing protein [Sporosarcina sp. ANT_H38]
MDLFIVIIDVLVVISYILLIAIISPTIMRLFKKRNYEILFQLIPVLSIIFVTSLVICIGYGGFQETLFFQFTSIISFLFLLSLLFLTLVMKNMWKENYEKLITWLASIRRKEIRFLKAK